LNSGVGESALPDGVLVTRCLSGDDAAWAAFVHRFSRYVHAIATRAYRLTGDDAEDVFQEVFARAWESLGTLRDPEAVRPWLAQLTRRCALDRLRATSRELPSDGELEPPGADETMEELDEAMDVRQAMARLPEGCGEILDRFFCRDQSYRDIGDALAIPAGTVASRISRCLDRLREKLVGRSAARTASIRR
jgi:RNA polymerase sigma-70 factor, ECF subfamily